MSTDIQNIQINSQTPKYLKQNINHNINIQKQIEFQQDQQQNNNSDSDRSTISSLSTLDQNKNKNDQVEQLQNNNHEQKLNGNQNRRLLPPKAPLNKQQQKQQQLIQQQNKENEQLLVENMKPSLKYPETIKNITQLLPMQIASLSIKKVTWKDFKGVPDKNETYSAHIYWYITYSYDMKMKPLYTKKVEYVANISTAVSIREKSWNKKTLEHLLLHEQGHYLIGCLCALDFERKCKEYTFTNNYKTEIQRIFNSNLKEWLQRERDYDDETEHRLDFKEQERWDRYIIDKLSEFYKLFNENNKNNRNNYHFARRSSLKENIQRNKSNNNRSGSVKNREILKNYTNKSYLSNGNLVSNQNNNNNQTRLPSINNIDKKWKF